MGKYGYTVVIAHEISFVILHIAPPLRSGPILFFLHGGNYALHIPLFSCSMVSVPSTKGFGSDVAQKSGLRW